MDIRSRQARYAALGFNPGPIDGIMGDRTQEAEQEAMETLGKSRWEDLFHSSGLYRIHWHWTAGSNGVIEDELKHYHYVIDDGGEVVSGVPVEDNADPIRGSYAAHTLNANTGAIGISIDAMHGAKERPFEWGLNPIKPEQVRALAKLTAKLSERFWIPVSKYSTLSHSEVQPTLGIEQKWKWDINVLPGMDKPGDPIDVGDKIREMVRVFLEQTPPVKEADKAWTGKDINRDLLRAIAANLGETVNDLKAAIEIEKG